MISNTTTRAWLVGAMAALMFTGCATTSWQGYNGGMVKSSQVRYDYTARPPLSKNAGQTYKVVSDGSMAGVTSVPALEAYGIKRAYRDADVTISLKGGNISHEPGAFGLGGSYEPVFTSRMPVTISIKDRGGRVLLTRTVRHEEILRIKGSRKFKTREEAKAAMASIKGFTSTAADKKVRAGAPRTASKNLSLISKELFEPRDISVTLPAIRSAGEVNMEAAHSMLSNARSREQAKRAQAAYAALGTEHKKKDGSKDVVGVYGVLCGSASAKVLSGDLGSAWQDTKRAWKLMPEGKEHRQIAQVLKQQQDQAGLNIITTAELNEMNNADINAALNQLKGLFGSK
jgi:hypothetical protein